MKKIILLMTIVLCTACSAEYNLTLNDNSFNEELNAMNIDSSSYYNELSVQRFPFKSQYGTLIDAVAPVVSDKFPESNKKDISKNNENNIQYFYEFNLGNYGDSNIANSCYQFFSVDAKENEVSILTGNKFYCFDVYEELDSVTININSNYKVIQSNADKIVGKKHTWYITRENASNKPIIFVYDKSKKNMTIMQYLIDNVPLVVVVGTTLTLGGITFLIINTKKKKANKI